MKSGLNKRPTRRLSAEAGVQSLPAVLDGLLHAVKLPVCLMAAMSSVFGHILFLSRFDGGSLAIFAGVFLLATGACCFNVIQEKSIDGGYSRTRERTRAIAALSPALLVTFASVCCICGGALLALFGQGLVPTLLGLVSLFFYNAVYTPMKRRSGFALIPGGVAGALPPVIGWTAAGGSLPGVLPVFLFVLFFLWQIPHFSLILLSYAGEYRRQGTFRNIATSLSEQSLRRITAIWLLSLGTSLLFLTVIPGLLPVTAKAIIVAATMMFLATVVILLFYKAVVPSRKIFIFLNTYFFFCMVVVAIGAMVS